MANAVLEKDMLIAQQQWKNFISLIDEDLKEIYSEKRKLEIEKEKFSQVQTAILYGQEDIKFLIDRKGSILAIDASLEKDFMILEAFNSKTNLDNAVAIRVYNKILTSSKLQNCSEMINNLISRIGELQNKFNMINDLIYGEDFDEELIEELCNKHNLSESTKRAIKLYPNIKTLRKTRVLAPKKIHTPEEEKKNNEINHQETGAETLYETSKEEITYKDEFDKVKDVYDKLKMQTNSLLNKYYVILSNLTPKEMNQYRIYCSLSDNDLQDLKVKGIDEKEFEFSEIMATITAIKVFDAKIEIENLIKSISTTDYSDKEDIEMLMVWVEEYENLTNKLMSLDNEIVKHNPKNPNSEVKTEKVFFLVNEAMQPMIPDEIKENFRSSLVSLFDKAESGLIQQKRCNNIVLKINDKEFKEKCGRTIFSARNNKIAVSYIKLNAIDNDGGILILTSSLLTGNSIQEDTDKIIKKYGNQILQQIDAIEREEPQQLELQKMIREEYIKSSESNLGGR